MDTAMFPSEIVIVRKPASVRLVDCRCPKCGKKLCNAQILCIIEIKCGRTGCGTVVRIEPQQETRLTS